MTLQLSGPISISDLVAEFKPQAALGSMNVTIGNDTFTWGFNVGVFGASDNLVPEPPIGVSIATSLAAIQQAGASDIWDVTFEPISVPQTDWTTLTVTGPGGPFVFTAALADIYEANIGNNRCRWRFTTGPNVTPSWNTLGDGTIVTATFT